MYTSAKIFAAAAGFLSLVAAKCYDNSLIETTNLGVCNPSASVSQCCPWGQLCYANGLCHNPNDTSTTSTLFTLYFTNGCTDRTANTGLCLAWSRCQALGTGAGGSGLVDCKNNKWCCYGTGGCNCNNATQVFTLAAADILTSLPATSPAPTSTSTSLASSTNVAASTTLATSSTPVSAASSAASTAASNDGSSGISSSSSSSSNAAAIGGGVGGGVAALLILGALGFFFWRRHKKNAAKGAYASPPMNDGSGYPYTPYSPHTVDPKYGAPATIHEADASEIPELQGTRTPVQQDVKTPFRSELY